MERATVARPGYFRTGSDRACIPVAALKVGMRVIELDRPWEETPFLFQGFKIESVQQIEEVAAHCDEVVVEFSCEEWIPPVKREVLAKPVRRSRTFQSQTALKRDYDRAASVHEDARQLTRSVMDDVRLGRAIDVKQVKTTVSSAVKSMLESPDAMMWLARIRNRDEYTSEHCVNVGLLAINFGRHLGYGEEDLNRLGFVGMLHDVGKTLTPLEILNKEGCLDQREFEIMKAHVTDGRNILMSHKDVYHAAVDVAYGHHEALDGTGYPRKLKASSISEMTRIITLCDVYDAVTSDRCYRKGQSSRRALGIIDRERGKKFDPRLAEEFVRCIGLYPTGSIVELRGGAVGIVVNTNYRNRHLPRVLVVRDAEKQPSEERIIDLQKLSGQEGGAAWLIRDVVPNGAHGIRIEEYVRRGLQIV